MRRFPVLKPTISPPSRAAIHDGAAPNYGLAPGVVLLLSAYKALLSPLFIGACRFYPSCSDYMTEAVQTHGAWKGICLGTRRLGRCHPFGGHGIDHVPPPTPK